jgi:hypothetical protein
MALFGFRGLYLLALFAKAITKFHSIAGSAVVTKGYHEMVLLSVGLYYYTAREGSRQGFVQDLPNGRTQRISLSVDVVCTIPASLPLSIPHDTIA